METEVSKKDYNKYDGHARVANNNGVLTRELGGSYVKGKEYTGKIGDATVNGKKEDKTSVNINVVATKDGTKASAEVQQSTTYSGSAEVGNNKIDGSAGKTDTIRAKAIVTKNSASVRASYEEKYHANANAKFGNTEVNAKGQLTSKTGGRASVKLDKNGLSAKANVVKDLGAKASFTTFALADNPFLSNFTDAPPPVFDVNWPFALTSVFPNLAFAFA